MKPFKKIPAISFTFFFISLLALGCQKDSQPAPFFDGLFLEYSVKGLRLIYNVHALDDKKFKLIRTEKREPLSDEVDELLVDAYGRVYESTYKGFEDEFSPIWIPVHEMEIGDKFDRRKLVERKDKWGEWDVLLVKEIEVGIERYYDLNTGYLVGEVARTLIGTSRAVLVNTNADIPTAKE